MRSIVQMIVAACAMAVVGSPVFAQTPAPAAPPSAGGTPDAMPFDIPYGVSIGLERAKQVMAAAEAEAKRRNWKMNIAVVDTNG
nr:heme-binding protein [Bradyrhizobium sp.]